MIPRDWRNKTQGVFTTGYLRKKSPDQLHRTCAFERDLQDYLARYQNLEVTRRISTFDFSGVKAVLVASVPGSFSGQEKNKWGHMRLRSVLRQQVELSQDAIEKSKIIVQISSIGSLGSEATDWLRGEFEVSLNAYRNQTYGSRGNAELAIVYPTAEDVRTSFEGWEMGTSLPFQSKAYEKQAHYLKGLLHKWKAEKSGRERAMPHIKVWPLFE
ncbi:tyrosyl-DNA phosphodiesterase 1 [Actinomortierella wolfii]|nr:tyrosyl-DNA phosphodiesterase 1 [Actinomortierella wolfii]